MWWWVCLFDVGGLCTEKPLMNIAGGFGVGRALGGTHNLTFGALVA